MQLVYFRIAAFNLAADSCGLYYSHQTLGVYQASIDEVSFFDCQMVSSGIVADTAAAAQAEQVRGHDTKAIGQARLVFTSIHMTWGSLT